jgi:23S rRNA (guanosine2251-2'-O)-methyltransferase
MSGKTLTYGLQPVLEALEQAPEAAKRLYLSTQRRKDVDHLISLAEGAGVAVERVSPEDLSALCGGGHHQGVALEGREFRYRELSELLRRSEGEPEAVLLVLDQVQDPMNLGAVLRTAAASGVLGVVLPDRRAASVTPAVVRASAGQAMRVWVSQVSNLARALEEIKGAGFWVAGGASRGGKAPWEVDLRGKVALVMGSEGQGMRRLTQEACDHLLTLPLGGGVESLNVSAAAAMLMYECVRQRRGV